MRCLNKYSWIGCLAAAVPAFALAVTAGAAQAESAANAAPSGTLTIAWPWGPGTVDAQMHRQRYTQIMTCE
jgi:hypothetical protein